MSSQRIEIIDDEWCSVDIESRLNKKIDALNQLVHQQHDMIQTLSTAIQHLQTELHSAKTQTHSQNDRTHQLLEELKVLKQRELNMALRSHLPVPFTTAESPLFSTKSIPTILRSPLFRAKVSPNPTTLPPFPDL
jgi:hypothetical protein